MDQPIEHLWNVIDELDEKISYLLNRVTLLEMRIENLEKKLDEDESPSF